MIPEVHAAPAATLRVSEIFLSLQGESSFAGLPCVFVRLAGCHLRCSYCDTAYAFTDGETQTLEAVQAEVLRLAQPFANAPGGKRMPLVELTGGEPLLQANSLPLMRWLCDQDFTVLLETSGALDITAVDPRVHRIVDLKCPGSGEADRNCWENIPALRTADEIKFVISSRQDYAWAKEILRRFAFPGPVLFSCVAPLKTSPTNGVLKSVPPGHDPITRRELAESIVRDGLAVRFQIQLHKEIWPPDARGV
jgi:7-carboxy-7-deazaguanine synthase